MIIPTIAEANAVNCCGCNWPVCAAPRKETEICGFELPLNDDLSPADYTRRFGKQIQEETRSDTYGDGFTVVYNFTASTTYAYPVPCTTEYFVQSASYEESYNWTYPDRTESLVSIGSIVATVDNGLTVTYTEDPGDGDYVNELENCPVIQHTTPATLESNAGGVVVFSSTDTTWGFSGSGTITLKTTFEDELSERYRFGVPAGYSTIEIPRTTWEMTWDEMTASADWWAWYDGGMEGSAPDVSLALVTARDWTWAGDMEAPWSEWYEIPLPDPGMITRVVNIMVVCWKSTRLGNKPTAHGDQVALPE